MSCLLILDFNNMLFRSVCIMPFLKSKDGIYTGGLYGFIAQMCSLINTYDVDGIVVCTDAPPYKRKELFPEYKQRKGERRDPDMMQRINQSRILCTDMLAQLCIPVWSIAGMEADDLIYTICERQGKAGDGLNRIIVSSNDDDLFQLFRLEEKNSTLKILLHRSGKLYGYNNFKEEYPDVTLKDWIWCLALAGTHNAVPGINRIGRKTALKIIRESKLQETISKHPITTLYHRIIELPFESITEDLPSMYPRYSDKRFDVFLKKYEIQNTNAIQMALRRWKRRNDV